MSQMTHRGIKHTWGGQGETDRSDVGVCEVEIEQVVANSRSDLGSQMGDVESQMHPEVGKERQDTCQSGGAENRADLIGDTLFLACSC